MFEKSIPITLFAENRQSLRTGSFKTVYSCKLAQYAESDFPVRLVLLVSFGPALSANETFDGNSLEKIKRSIKRVLFIFFFFHQLSV